MQITFKSYYCGICGTEEEIETNHYGEIYSPCKCCGNSVRACKENIETPNNKVTLHYYRFDISEQQEKDKYDNLVKYLNDKNYKKPFLDVAPYCTSKFHLKWSYIAKKDNSELNVYNQTQFDTQFVSDGIRLHQWCEALYPNKKIKEGYYIIFDKEVK